MAAEIGYVVDPRAMPDWADPGCLSTPRYASAQLGASIGMK
jgi:hypothetical protein